jgi:transposase-like protein
VRDSSAESILPFVREVVGPGSVIITDGLPTYDALPQAGYDHRRLVVRGSGQNPDALLPRVHRVVSLLKRWLLGTHQGAVERKHLPYYLDEFTFRFNRRTSRRRGMLFYRLAQQALAVDPAPYRSLVGGSERHAPQDVGVT